MLIFYLMCEVWNVIYLIINGKINIHTYMEPEYEAGRLSLADAL